MSRTHKSGNLPRVSPNDLAGRPLRCLFRSPALHFPCYSPGVALRAVLEVHVPCSLSRRCPGDAVLSAGIGQ